MVKNGQGPTENASPSQSMTKAFMHYHLVLCWGEEDSGVGQGGVEDREGRVRRKGGREGGRERERQ